MDVIFLQKEHALNGQYCTTLLWQLNGTVLYHLAVTTQRDSTVPPCCDNSTGQYCTTLVWQLNGTVLYPLAVTTQRDSTVPPCCGNSTGQYCTTLLWQVDGSVIAKCRRKLTKGAPCHQGNALAHKSAVVVIVLYNSGFEPVDQKPFSRCNNNNNVNL